MYRVLFIVGLTVFLNSHTYAQADGPCDPFDPQPGCENFDPDVPLDGGASVLVAAGIAYGVKKIRDKRKKDKEEAL